MLQRCSSPPSGARSRSGSFRNASTASSATDVRSSPRPRGFSASSSELPPAISLADALTPSANASTLSSSTSAASAIDPGHQQQQSVKYFDAPSADVLISLFETVIVDTLSRQSSGIDVLASVIEALPLEFDDATSQQLQAFQTILLSRILQTLKSEVVTSASLEKSTDLAANVTKLCEFVVDRKYSGQIRGCNRLSLEFFSHLQTLFEGLVQNQSTRWNPMARIQTHLQSVCRSVNRMFIFLLSAEETTTSNIVLAVFAALREFSRILFAPQNDDAEMLGTICVELHRFICSDVSEWRDGAIETMRVVMECKQRMLTDLLTYKDGDEEPRSLVTSGFSKIFSSRDEFLSWFRHNDELVKRVFAVTVDPLWLQRKEHENVVKEAMSRRLVGHQQRREEELARQWTLRERLSVYTRSRTESLRQCLLEELEAQKRQKRMTHDRFRVAREEWRVIRREVYRPRTIWDNDSANALLWRLDTTEGPSRMRLRMEPFGEAWDSPDKLVPSASVQSPLALSSPSDAAAVPGSASSYNMSQQQKLQQQATDGFSTMSQADTESCIAGGDSLLPAMSEPVFASSGDIFDLSPSSTNIPGSSAHPTITFEPAPAADGAQPHQHHTHLHDKMPPPIAVDGALMAHATHSELLQSRLTNRRASASLPSFKSRSMVGLSSHLPPADANAPKHNSEGSSSSSLDDDSEELELAIETLRPSQPAVVPPEPNTATATTSNSESTSVSTATHDATTMEVLKNLAHGPTPTLVRTGAPSRRRKHTHGETMDDEILSYHRKNSMMPPLSSPSAAILHSADDSDVSVAVAVPQSAESPTSSSTADTATHNTTNNNLHLKGQMLLSAAAGSTSATSSSTPTTTTTSPHSSLASPGMHAMLGGLSNAPPTPNTAALIREASILRIMPNSQSGVASSTSALGDLDDEHDDVESSTVATSAITSPTGVVSTSATGGKGGDITIDVDDDLEVGEHAVAGATQVDATVEPLSEHESDEELGDEDDFGQKQLQRLIDPHDRVDSRLLFNCARVHGQDVIEGVLLLCERHLYVIDNYAVNNGVVVEVSDESIPDMSSMHGQHSSQHRESIAVVGKVVEREAVHGSSRTVVSHHVRRWAYSEIRELHKRRYLLRGVALELFATDGRNYMLLFHLSERDKVHDLILSQQLPNLCYGNFVTAAAGSAMTLGGRRRNIARHLKLWLKTTMQRWQRGEVSNFQYLMFLNTLAGRTYNDLTQYPVFPWVLSDYESEELDLDDPSVYRDLSKPMGALSEERAEMFRNRFEEWDDPDVPKWHYGSHYSLAGVVLHYLVRIEPFASLAQQLQGGHFDKPDRLFHSVSEAWLSASKLSVTDIKELIPEFFYLPEFLDNSNGFEFGKRSNGVVMDHVLLPPWAKNSPHEFILKHRQALESEHVSRNLHHWIDLIFGYKQQGKAAEEALNVFYYLTYEGKVDIDKISDPIEKAAVIAQINNFGQTPQQLFSKPHPQRLVMPSTNPYVVYHCPERFVPGDQRLIGEPVFDVRTNASDRMFFCGKNTVMVPPKFNKLIAFGFPDHSLRMIRVANNKTMEVYEGAHEGQILCAAISSDGRTLVTGGEDTVVSVWHVSKHAPVGKHILHVARLCGHGGPVTAVAISTTFSVILTGSEDRTCLLWDLNRKHCIRQFGLTRKEESLPRADTSLVYRSLHQGKSYAMMTELERISQSALDVSRAASTTHAATAAAAASNSSNRQQLEQHPDLAVRVANCHPFPVSCVYVDDSSGMCISCSGGTINVWSINGDLLLQSVTTSNLEEYITAVTQSHGPLWDDNNVIITGHVNGWIQFWSAVPPEELNDYDTESLASSISATPAAASAVAAQVSALELVTTTNIPGLPSNKSLTATAGSTLSLSAAEVGLTTNDDATDPMLAGAHISDDTTKAEQELITVNSVRSAPRQQYSSVLRPNPRVLKSRFIHKDVHRAPITALHVSESNLKMVSGDASGCVLQWTAPVETAPQSAFFSNPFSNPVP